MIPPRLRCDYSNWKSPKAIVEAIRKLFDGEIALDPFSDREKWTGATKNYLTKGETKGWMDRTFANPPYGGMVESAATQAHIQAAKGYRIALLLPCGSRFSTKYFQREVLNEHLTCILIFNKRLRFVREGIRTGSMMHDTALWLYNVRIQNAAECLCQFGRVLEVSIWS